MGKMRKIQTSWAVYSFIKSLLKKENAFQNVVLGLMVIGGIWLSLKIVGFVLGLIVGLIAMILPVVFFLVLLGVGYLVFDHVRNNHRSP